MIVNCQTELSDNSSFKVPSVIIDSYAKETNPVYFMIYVYTLRQLYSGNFNISNSEIASALRVSDIDVLNAFLFYSSKGLIKVHNFTSVDDVNFDIEFCFDDNTKRKSSVEFRPTYNSSEIARELNDNPRVSSMYKMVSQFMGKALSSADITVLYSLYDFYRLPCEVILVLVEYLSQKGKTSMKLIEKEAIKWVDAGVDNVSKAKAYIKKREQLLSYANRVRAALLITDRKLTSKELGFINKWQTEYKSDVDMVKFAFELTVNQTGKLSFPYMNKILEDWSKNKITSSQEISKKPHKAPAKSGYDYDLIEKLAIEKMNRHGGEN